MDPEKHEDEKAGLIIAAIIVGAAIFILTCIQSLPATEKVNVGGFFSPHYVDRPTTVISMWHRSGLFIAIAVVAAIGSSFLYVILAAYCAEMYIRIRSWAYCGKAKRPEDNEILVIGTIWPIALLGGGLIFLFIGIINRSFN